MTRISFDMNIEKVSRYLIWFSAAVIGLGFFREAYIALFGTDTVLKDLRHIALDTEHCIAAYYSSVLMLIAAGVMTIIGQASRGNYGRVHWYVLAIIFVAMSIDESVSFHEVLIEPLRPAFTFSSYLHFAWIVPGALFVLGLGLSYLPFVFSLPAQIRNRIILSGVLYVGGALGFEAVGGHFNALGGFESPLYIASFLIEESLEIVGLTLFATTLIRDLPRHFLTVEAAERHAQTASAAPATATARSLPRASV